MPRKIYRLRDDDSVDYNEAKSILIKKTVDIEVSDSYENYPFFTKLLPLSHNMCIVKILFHPDKNNINYGIDINSMFFSELCDTDYGIKGLKIYEVFEQTVIQTSIINAKYNTALMLSPGLWLTAWIDNYGIKQIRSTQFKITICYIEH